MFGVSVADSGGPIALGDGSSGEAFTGRAANKEAGLASALLQVTGVAASSQIFLHLRSKATRVTMLLFLDSP